MGGASYCTSTDDNASSSSSYSGLSPAERQTLKIYTHLMTTYHSSQPQIDRMEELKRQILSYTPGSFSDYKPPYVDLRNCRLTNATSLLLIGPSSSGKSSLVNKISTLFDGEVHLPPRAQVSSSCSSPPVRDGTLFINKYMIPRSSNAFCLYDTRSLSGDSSENKTMIRDWLTRGIRHGEFITRNSDSVALKAQLKWKAWRCFSWSRAMPVGFFIFVVNGVSVLEAMDSDDDTKKEYIQTIAANFKYPYLSFKDDKPAVVVTHGDLLQLSDRIRVRAYLGELLGVPPTEQIFDIPENNDPATTLAILDMLIFCLNRADRNRPNLLLRDKGVKVNLLLCIASAAAVASGTPGLVVFFSFMAGLAVCSGFEHLRRGRKK